MLWKLWLRRNWPEALFLTLLSLTLWLSFKAYQQGHDGRSDYMVGAVVIGIVSIIMGILALIDMIGFYRYAYLEINDKGERVVKVESELDEDRIERALFSVRIPHGGLFRRSCRYERGKPTRGRPMSVLMGETLASWKSAVQFRDGVLLLDEEKAVRLLYALPNLSQREDDLPSCEEIVNTLLELQDERDRLRTENEERGRRVSTLLDALTETVRTLSDTRRVGKSKEARRMKDDVLLPTLDRHLVPDDPRRGEFGIAVKEPAASVPASTAPVPAIVS